MADIEKVIESLEICLNDLNICGNMCEKCQYESNYHKHCHEILMADALELLKNNPSKDWFCADGERREADG